ncbi:cyclophilin-like family protein [Gynuella sunshinyii]|uniref:Cyclophilin TM1367-like domain-containing protein n=1 Tax=Gynuella sunshinyii YC6258 TaxID=1445510 RepID=A0A0C5VU40_9GAMM|nr:cyclophilin-like fold protein [Gynuella sunshinyii]AJQ93894.1 hypothetical protein YC6258_01850 [Gynuella sunshinyii YC6258]
MSAIRIFWPSGQVTITLRDTISAKALLAARPIQSTANIWGDEVYCQVPFTVAPEADASTVVDKGAVCFWLEGNALALLFGPTPISSSNECRLISAANILGHIDGNPELLRSINQHNPIRIEPV